MRSASRLAQRSFRRTAPANCKLIGRWRIAARRTFGIALISTSMGGNHHDHRPWSRRKIASALSRPASTSNTACVVGPLHLGGFSIGVGLALIDIGRGDRDFLDQSRVGVGTHMSLNPWTAARLLCLTQRALPSSSLAEAMMVASQASRS